MHTPPRLQLAVINRIQGYTPEWLVANLTIVQSAVHHGAQSDSCHSQLDYVVQSPSADETSHTQSLVLMM